jgi:hypothetical protein
VCPLLSDLYSTPARSSTFLFQLSSLDDLPRLPFARSLESVLDFFPHRYRPSLTLPNTCRIDPTFLDVPIRMGPSIDVIWQERSLIKIPLLVRRWLSTADQGYRCGGGRETMQVMELISQSGREKDFLCLSNFRSERSNRLKQVRRMIKSQKTRILISRSKFC